ncbi:hypothetical protein CAEBREN_26194 [Caenorhabditis brenneri]|uniref:Uncharacterized protein n=1 Tax=Caenorhabditis brenneri TaxID=135651 RepID=G0N0R7_CAEBE|nr:hypothetical protein CAEBREN_26194 [Caenorhabditis brenneri]
MDSMSLEERAADYLKSKGINSLFPTFRGSSVIGASRMKVKVAATMDELKMGVDEMSHMFARLGHLVSKSTWMLQENPCDADDVIVQNHLHYVQHDDPPVENKVIHITAKADRITNGRHHVSFRIVKFDGRREVLIGSGHSTLEILHRPPPPSTIASEVLVASLGGEANPKAAKPASIAPLPALPSATAAAAAPTIASPAHSTIAASSPVTASAAPIPPLSASAPQAPPARPRALSSILGRRSDPLRKRVRHVSFGCATGKHQKYHHRNVADQEMAPCRLLLRSTRRCLLQWLPSFNATMTTTTVNKDTTTSQATLLETLYSLIIYDNEKEGQLHAGSQRTVHECRGNVRD